MSKELSEETKYEFNVFARQLNKDLSNLMEYLRKQDEDNKAILYVGRHIKKKVILPYEEYQKMCQRLEDIDNAKPSKALNDLENIKNFEGSYGTLYDSHREQCNTIKQALIKAQEQKKVLKIIFEKRVNVDLFWNDFVDNGFGYHYYLEKWYKYQSIDRQKLTEEEFDLLKRYFK